MDNFLASLFTRPFTLGHGKGGAAHFLRPALPIYRPYGIMGDGQERVISTVLLPFLCPFLVPFLLIA